MENGSIFQAVGFFRLENSQTQAVLPPVGLAADKINRDLYIGYSNSTELQLVSKSRRVLATEVAAEKRTPVVQLRFRESLAISPLPYSFHVRINYRRFESLDSAGICFLRSSLAGQQAVIVACNAFPFKCHQPCNRRYSGHFIFDFPRLSCR